MYEIRRYSRRLHTDLVVALPPTVILPDIEQVGSIQNYPINNDSHTGTISSVDVPTGTELVIVALGCFHTEQRYHTNRSVVYMMKGGVDTPLLPLGNASEASVGGYQGAMWYMLAPDISASNYIKWDWAGTSLTADPDHSWSVTFWSGVDPANPIRSSGGDQRGGSGFPATSPTLDAETGDVIVAHVTGYNASGTPSFDTWTNLTALGSMHEQNTSAGQWATHDPTADVAVSVNSGTNVIEPTIMAAALRKPYSRGTTSIVQTGSTISFDVNDSNNTGTVSAAITVPADAEIVIVGMSSYNNVANYFSNGTVTFTKGSTDTAMTSAGVMDGSTAITQGGLWYLVLPDTGTNKSLKWDWEGVTGSSQGQKAWFVTFWKGINTSSPVRDSGGTSSLALPASTATLTAQNGDLLVGFCGFFIQDTGFVSVTNAIWRDLEQVGAITVSSAYGAVLGKVAPTGNMPVVVTSGIVIDGVAFGGIVLKPA